MIRSTLPATSISSCGMTFTSGFRALIVLRADSIVGVEDLALQVRQVDHVEVDDADRADAGGREVERRRGAETAGADEQRLRAEEPGLAGRADLGDQEMAAVALLLLRRQDDRRVPPVAGR